MAKRVKIDTPAPDFALNDYGGQSVHLSDYAGKKHVILIFNRGFV
jgi:peroxiredoxin